MKMFKRFAACLLAAALAAGTLTACSGGITAKQTIAPIAAPTGQVAAENSRVAKFIGGKSMNKMYLDTDVTRVDSDGASTSKCAIAWDSSVSGFYMHDAGSGLKTVSDGKTLYVADDKGKSTYGISLNNSKDDPAKTLAGMTSVAGLKTLDCGTMNIDGVNYYFESRTVTDNDGDTSTVYYCFDPADTAGRRMSCIVSETQYERTIYKINSSSTSVDPTLFDIPKEYSVGSDSSDGAIKSFGVRVSKEW